MIALTGGGTGGHLAIVKCLLESAMKFNIECIYIGSENGQDKAWFENDERFKEKYFLQSKGVVSKKGLAKLFALFDIFKLALQTKQILKKHDIQAVFSVGGYSAAPASFAALLSQIPFFIHEQNSKKGSLNSLLKPFASKFYSAFEKTFCPYPVHDKFFNENIRKKLQTIIFLGGSQGASFINLLALNLASKLDEKGIKIIHQCGKNELEKCQKTYDQLGIKADIFDFCENLEEKMQEADLAISRAGASTLFELCANSLPCIFVPYPYAAKNHQYFNALFLQKQNLAEIFTQDEDENKLLEMIFKLNLQELSSRLQSVVQKNAADFLLQDALNLKD
ncbi:undecaprenyldiphospho-muramoylpentapeptide beta-N-acetylglucosaminyltransferase [Campylobacter sp. MIT 99-7217]|uniref:undecaprenyldiphospho-muramoylpentapeptide beta-N-acetylglucosaminyltransferase n=1 Tax=Campylobacter sp. MIT 99-7217 TaxID=535091 RepID=UPI0011585B41|nr:undecaprenyldiphospho-muramoylpentapeptide beta-N-acetylglucosaminyltransferase [Campylobacter sp. MIT 99-7217]TQR33148.1 undecaprenyldiphospho-muramoylpentapeptide beta-N-acetylglucosaminyltransferase [Campylobacter sp. MIT 99-7217]